MFEAAELGRRVSKSAFDEAEETLRTQLLEAQRALRGSSIPVIVIVSGVEGAGKSDVVNRFNTWLDTRGVQVHAFWEETDEERERPRHWRFWRRLPPRGSIGLLFGSWYTQPVVARVHGELDEGAFERELNRIVEFEQMLTDDGALIVKLWFHLSREQQTARLGLEDGGKAAGGKKEKKEKGKGKKGKGKKGKDKKGKGDDAEPGESASRKLSRGWKRPLPLQEQLARRYDDFLRVSERAIRVTDTGACAWHLVEATCPRYRDLTAGQILLEALRRRLAHPVVEAAPVAPTVEPVPVEPSAAVTILDHVDLSPALDKDVYHTALRDQQRRLNELTWRVQEERSCSVVALFEGWDASGKGGAIRRAVAAMDARLLQVIATGAPTDEERAHHYLWRFWRHIPPRGYVRIYDRSWYGRVLVERVEGFARPSEWRRAYQEINDLEEHLVESGAALAKFWLHISKEEQLRRFEERERTPWKQHKITEEDWRNRERWDDYKAAVNDMVAHTSTSYAPWTLIAGDDKRHARVEVLRTLGDRIEAALEA